MADYNGRRISVPWKVSDVALAIVLVFASFVLILFLATLATGILGAEERTLLTPWLVGATEGVMLAAVWVFGINRYKARWQTLGLRRPEGRRTFAWPLLAVVASLGFASVYAATVTAIGVDSLEPPTVQEQFFGQGATRLVNTAVVVMWVPFAEEVFFRGFLLAALLPSMGAVRAAVVSSAVFALAHLLVSTMLPIFVTGLLLSWLYLRSRSLWPPIAAHAMQNLIAISLAA